MNEIFSSKEGGARARRSEPHADSWDECCDEQEVG
jgi:hypothetical protein